MLLYEYIVASLGGGKYILERIFSQNATNISPLNIFVKPLLNTICYSQSIIDPELKFARNAWPLCCWWLIWPIQNDAKKLKNDWTPGTLVLIWEYSSRAIQWIPTWHALDGFQKSLHPYDLIESSLSIGRVKHEWNKSVIPEVAEQLLTIVVISVLPKHSSQNILKVFWLELNQPTGLLWLSSELLHN